MEEEEEPQPLSQEEPQPLSQEEPQSLSQEEPQSLSQEEPLSLEEPLSQEGSCSKPKHAEPFQIPKETVPILIGTGGRNICLVGKCSQTFIQCNSEGEVQVFARHPNSNLPRAHRMIRSIIAGGVLRWFTHPSSTHKIYPVPTRPQMQELAAALTHHTCSLQLLRAHSGHLCLFLMPSDDVEGLEEEIGAARPALLAELFVSPQGRKKRS